MRDEEIDTKVQNVNRKNMKLKHIKTLEKITTLYHYALVGRRWFFFMKIYKTKLINLTVITIKRKQKQ